MSTAADPIPAEAPRRHGWLHRPEAQAQRGAGTWLPAPLLTRVGHIVLWLLVLGGAGAGVASLVLHAVVAEPPVAVAAPAPTTPAEGFAELYVAAYLQAGQGEEAALAAFHAGTVSLAEVTPGAVWVLRTTAVDAEELAAGYWAVAVAADVLVAREDGWEPGGLRYYTVGVAATPEGLVATGLPGEIAAPRSVAASPPLAVAALSRPDDGPAVEAAGRFLAAYLAGDGELDRYTAPGAALHPVVPPPFTDVALRRAGIAERAAGGTLVRAEAAATDPAGLIQVLEYSLEVVERDGRFEVAALHPAPPLSPTPR